MLVLAVDTSSRCGAIGLAQDGEVLAELSLTSRENHSARLLPGIDWVLKSLHLSLEAVDVFGVVTGPGSFTGLRVGLSTVKGFAWSLNKPLVELSSLEVLALGVENTSSVIVPMLDARRGQVYGAAYRVNSGELENLHPESDISVTELLNNVPGSLLCLGNGSRVYQEEILQAGSNRVQFAPTPFDLPRGAVLAERTHAKARLGMFVDATMVAPNYMRKSEAEVKLKERKP